MYHTGTLQRKGWTGDRKQQVCMGQTHAATIPVTAYGIHSGCTGLPLARTTHVRALSCRATNEFEVREITDDDVQTLVDVQTSAFFEPTPFEFMNGLLKSFFRAEVLDSLKGKMRCTSVEDEGSAVIYVATPCADTSEPVAILEMFVGNDQDIVDTIEEGARVTRPEKYVWLASMAVSEQFRRQGCARVLLDAAHEKLYDLECEWAVLSVYPENQAAIQLYESAGYTIFGTQGNRILDFLGSKSRVIMMRPRDGVKAAVGCTHS